jgi:hypothetical protein
LGYYTGEVGAKITTAFMDRKVLFILKEKAKMKAYIELEIEDNEVKSAKVVKFARPTTQYLSHYARIFDEGCTGWTNDPEYIKLFLKAQQNYANDLLKQRGYLFLNEVYDMLGVPRTKEGQCVGWIYDEKDTSENNYVDFGLALDINHDFMNGYGSRPWLDFNVDGYILDHVEKGKESE